MSIEYIIYKLCPNIKHKIDVSARQSVRNKNSSQTVNSNSVKFLHVISDNISS